MKLPYSYKDISVKQYQSIHPLLKDDMTIDDWVAIIAKLSGLSVAEVETIPIKHLKNYLIQVSFLNQSINHKPSKKIRIGKHFYKGCLDAEMLNTAQYTSIKTFCKDGDIVGNLDKICACLYSKLTWKGYKYDANKFKEACEDFQSVSIAEVYGVVFFCSKVLTNLMESTPDYLAAIQVIKEREQEIIAMILEPSFLSSGDGTQPLTI
jgi:hypothetical protein